VQTFFGQERVGSSDVHVRTFWCKDGFFVTYGVRTDKGESIFVILFGRRLWTAPYAKDQCGVHVFFISITFISILSLIFAENLSIC